MRANPMPIAGKTRQGRHLTDDGVLAGRQVAGGEQLDVIRGDDRPKLLLHAAESREAEYHDSETTVTNLPHRQTVLPSRIPI